MSTPGCPYPGLHTRSQADTFTKWARSSSLQAACHPARIRFKLLSTRTIGLTKGRGASSTESINSESAEHGRYPNLGQLPTPKCKAIVSLSYAVKLLLIFQDNCRYNQ